MSAIEWVLVGGSFASAVGTLALIRYLLPYRTKPGAEWFIAALGFQTLWCLCYGVGLLTVDPTVRAAFEAGWLVAVYGVGACFFAFALGYTGRSHLIRSPVFLSIGAVLFLAALAVVTNPLHGLVWQDFAVVPTGGVATVTYTKQPLLFGGVLFAVAAIAAGVFLLVDTVLSYGPLYRREAAAVAVSTLPPAVAFLVWLFELGPLPQANFATVAFLPHVALDTYAFVRSDMFEFHPATRRAGQQAAIEDLGSPVVIVDEAGRIVNLNAAAERLLSTRKRDALTRRLNDLYEGDPVDPSVPEQDLTVRRQPGTATYKTSSTPLDDVSGSFVGYTIIFQDITVERRREQRLQVLNRILRHNLRNDLNVVSLIVDDATNRVDDPALADNLGRASEAVDDLIAVSEKARDLERIMDANGEGGETISLRRLLDAAVADLPDAAAEGRVTVSVTEDVTVQTNVPLAVAIFSNLVENGLKHHDGDDPSVTLELVEADAETVTVTVTDAGPGIPAHEVETIQRGEESALAHGSGLGLWLVEWGVRTLGGDVTFHTPDEGGTVVSVRLPR